MRARCRDPSQQVAPASRGFRPLGGWCLRARHLLSRGIRNESPALCNQNHPGCSPAGPLLLLAYYSNLIAKLRATPGKCTQVQAVHAASASTGSTTTGNRHHGHGAPISLSSRTSGARWRLSTHLRQGRASGTFTGMDWHLRSCNINNRADSDARADVATTWARSASCARPRVHSHERLSIDIIRYIDNIR